MHYCIVHLIYKTLVWHSFFKCTLIIKLDLDSGKQIWFDEDKHLKITKDKLFFFLNINLHQDIISHKTRNVS